MKTILNFLEKNYLRIILTVLIMSLLLIFGSSLNRSFDHDEFEAIHTAWKISEGEVIYSDFFQHHHPLFYYLLVPFIEIFGENVNTILTIRFFIFLVLLGIVITTYLLARIIFKNKKWSLISATLLPLFIVFANKGIEVRPDIPQTFFGLLSVLFLFYYFDNRRNKNLILSSVFLGISFLFLQKTLFLIVLFGCFFIYLLFKKKIAYKNFLIYWGTLFFILILFAIFLFFSGNIKEYFFLNWALNINFLNDFSSFKYFLEIIKQNIIIFIFYIVGLLSLVKKRQLRGVGFLSLGLLLSVFLLKTPFAQNYLLALPFICIISVLGIKFIIKDKIIILLIILISSSISFNILAVNLQNSNKDQLNKINHILSITDKDDYIHDGDAQFNLFRKDLDYFWFGLKENGALSTYNSIRGYEYNTYDLIKKFKPKVVSDRFVDVSNEYIFNNYMEDNNFNHILIKIP
ncbi:phospholipid carrier-dependent glycosyltransferase [Candidatus Falkowbacteria bacterium]|jgi:4-amino-4-deoxy-L-arabinose transferase-like glycosyltransferase|nr:phospholipid carrier-dependent glycosyltransferase [Candidatus Falkowbacteria bacterium]MBT4433443.1 phospholipid carrier-dependent glycosyltransferase [Candidatus Falkowbacteria bacterium]